MDSYLPIIFISLAIASVLNYHLKKFRHPRILHWLHH